MSVVSLTDARSPFILVIDVGTSSLRALIYDAQAHEVQGLVARRKHQAATTDAGGSTLDADELFEAFTGAVDEVLAAAGQIEIVAVAASSLASNVLGLDAQNKPLTPVYLYSDTENARAVDELRTQYDWAPITARTGCPLHTAYFPARFRWLQETQPYIFEQATRWVALYDYFLLRVLGQAAVSHSFAAWSGLLNHTTLDWDEEALRIAGVRGEQLSPLVPESHGLRGLSAEFAARWKALGNAQWFPALGDGAVANIGSGCIDPTRVAVTVGTSAAMRVVLPAAEGLQKLPRGLWMYRVDEQDGLVGGSMNDGGSVFAYFSQLLQVPGREALERELEALPPDAHGLTMLPFFTGERSPGYHAEARAAVMGWSLGTSGVEVWRAAMEAISYRFAVIYELLLTEIPAPTEIIASGAALLNAQVWVQILADVLGVPVTGAGEEEASARGAALLALRAIGVISNLAELPASLGKTYAPQPAHNEVYRRAMERQKQLYHVLLEG